jgi:hypothetical protein
MFQVRLEPQWLLFKEVGMDFQIALGQHFSIGPTLGLMRGSESIMYGTMTSTSLGTWKDSVDRDAYGLRAVYYFSGFSRHSAFLAPFARYSKSRVSTTADGTFSSRAEKGEFTETTEGLTGGYQWVWKRFTMNLSAGMASYNHPDNVTMTDSTGSTDNRAIAGSHISYTIDAGIGFQF